MEILIVLVAWFVGTQLTQGRTEKPDKPPGRLISTLNHAEFSAMNDEDFIAWGNLVRSLYRQFEPVKRYWWERIPYSWGWWWRVPYGWCLKWKWGWS